MQTALSPLNGFDGSVTLALMRQYGAGFIFGQASAAAASFATAIQNGQVNTNALHPRQGVVSNRQPRADGPGQGGGGGYTCKTDSKALTVVGFAFGVLAALTIGPEALLAGTIWVGVAAYTGLGVTTWTGAHYLACNL